MESKEHLDLIRTLPCSICGAMGVTAHHAYGPSMTRQGVSKSVNSKVSDYLAIPLCDKHHQHGPDAVHVIGVAAFEELFGEQALIIDRLSDILGIQLWDKAKEKKQKVYKRSSKILPRVYFSTDGCKPSGIN